MAIAAYKDLCIDATDTARLSEFYARVLGLASESLDDGDARLSGSTARHTVWINTVPEPKTAKNRVHLDVHCGSLAELEALGARVVDPSFRWTIMADPEGQEFCAFVRDEVPDYRLYEIVWDCADPVAVARWWGQVLDAPAGDSDEGFSYVEPIPGAPFDAFTFSPVPEPKTVKNRVHIDVLVDALQPLLDVGATLLHAKDDEIGWNVMADIEGNEFCAFVTNANTPAQPRERHGRRRSSLT